MKIRKSAAMLALGLAVGGATLAGCDLGDKITEPFQDAPRSDQVNRQPVDIITDADGFSNAATKCDHGNRVYFIFHSDGPYGAIAVVPHDPTCHGDISAPAAGASR